MPRWRGACLRRRWKFSRRPRLITIRSDKALREAAASLGVKAGPMFQPIRVAVCGRKNAPPLFETMVVLGRDVCLERIAPGRRETCNRSLEQRALRTLQKKESQL